MSTAPSFSPRATPSVKTFLKTFVTGLLPKDVLLKRVFPLLFFTLIITTLAAGMVFPTAYDWRYMAISALGSPEDNPAGFWLMSLNGVCLCVLLIPVIGFIHRHLRVICRGMAGLGTVFASIGVVGLTLTSVLVGSTMLGSRTHENLALAAFLGFLFALFFWGFPLIKDRIPRYHGKRQFDGRLMAIATVMMWVIVIGMATGLGLEDLLYGNVPGLGNVGIEWIDPYHPDFVIPMPVWVSFPFWEWLLFWGMLACFVMIVMMLPATVEPLIPRAN
jgi:hypothetical protein